MKPLVLPDTTPEQIIAGVAPEGVVTASVLPVILVNNPVVPVIVIPLIVPVALSAFTLVLLGIGCIILGPNLGA